MDERTWQYKRIGRYITRRMYGGSKDGTCPDCDETKRLELHHIDGDTHNNKEDNVIFLCRVCHLRRERKDCRVGNRTRLSSKDIADITDGKETVIQLAKRLGMCDSYIRRIRKGEKNPKPLDTDVSVVPRGWEYKDLRGKPRALTVRQVKKLLALPILGRKTAANYCKNWNVSKATLYKVRSRRGCYADSIYD